MTRRRRPTTMAGYAETAPLSDPPAVSVIIATRHRPELLRRALQAVAGQSVPVAETLVVFDQSEPDLHLVEEFPAARIRVLTNTRSPGLAGARNTGIEAAVGDWVALCDDDDAWLADKLERQLALADESVDFVVGGVTVAYGDRRITRNAGLERISFQDLLRDRIMEAHPSTYLVRRQAISDYVGLVDEQIPGSYAEDYDWLLRAAKVRPIAVADGPVTIIQWHPDSYFGNKWPMIDEALAYLLEKTPEFATSPKGTARILGQRAFAQAAQGQRSTAWRTLRRAVRLNPTEPRNLLTMAVLAGVDAESLVKLANRVGRGI